MVFYHQKYYSLYLETYTQSQVILVSNAYSAQSVVRKLGTRLDSVFDKKAYEFQSNINLACTRKFKILPRRKYVVKFFSKNVSLNVYALASRHPLSRYMAVCCHLWYL